MRTHRRGILVTVGVIATIAPLLLVACATQKAPAPATKQTPSFEDCIRHGSASLSQGDSANAIEQFSKATTVNNRAPKAYNLLGMAYFQKRDYALAEQNFEHALALDPSYASPYANLGSVYFVRQDYEKAKDMLTKALALNPWLVSANYSMGSVLLALGDVEGGASYLSRGIALDPNYLDTHSTLVTNVPMASFGQGGIYFIYAKLFAATGDVEKTVEYLTKAKKAGFRDWHRITEEKELEKVRNDPRIQAFLPP